MSKKRGKSLWVCRLEYIALRTACALVNAVPYWAACFFARVLATFAFNVFGFKRKRTILRIQSVFPEKSRAEARKIAVFSLANLLMNAVEMIRAPRLDRKWVDRHVVDGALYAERLRSYVDEARGVVIMVPHAGNWYMAAWAMAQYGVPIFAIAAKQRNPYVNEWMRRSYGEGLDVVERGSARVLNEVKTRLSAGRAFAILPDLRVIAPDTEVSFLNGKANVSHGGAMFAVHTSSPIVVAMMRRIKGRHVFDHLATLRPDETATDKKAEACRLTREAMRLIDEAVRKTPEQWFWFNKRWILEPVNKQ